VQGADHHVDHFGVAHACAKAGGQTGVRRTAHVFCTTANGDVAVTQQDGLTGAHDGLQARAAQAVHVEGGCALGAAAVDGRHARQVHVFGLGVDHMAKHHMADILAVGACAGQGFAHDLCRQLGGGNVLEAAAKGTNGGAHTADNNNFTAHGKSPDLKIGQMGKGDNADQCQAPWLQRPDKLAGLVWLRQGLFSPARRPRVRVRSRAGPESAAPARPLVRVC